MSYEYESLFRRIFVRMLSDSQVSVGRLSAQLNVSRRTIQDVIRTRTGKSYRRLREEIFVARARQLLADNPCRSIKEVSYLVGFASTSSFARAVKRATGLSPEDLRSQVAANKDVRTP